MRHALTDRERSRIRTNSSGRHGYFVAVNFFPRRSRPIRGVRTDVVTTEARAIREAESLRTQPRWADPIRSITIVKVNALGEPDVDYDVTV